MNNTNSNDKSKAPQSNDQAGKDSSQGKDARPATATGNAPQPNATKDAKGTESPSKS